MRNLSWGILIAVICPLACQTTAIGPTPPADYSPQPLWEAIWQGNQRAVRDLSQAAAWTSTGSIEGERYRQAEWLAQGRRAELLAEATARLDESPFDPDLAYLQARLLQDPHRLAARFSDLAEQHPRHAWIRLGAAGAFLQLGELRVAQQHLAAAPDWADARDFRQLIAARLAEAAGEPEPWRGLLESALRKGSPTALSEVEAMARRAGRESLRELASVERSMRRVPVAGTPLDSGSAAEADALELLLRRLHAQLAWNPSLGLPEVIAQLDGWSERLGLPVVWGGAPHYRLPFGAGVLLRPERDAGSLSELLDTHRRAILFGWSWLEGTRAVELWGVDRVQLAWPSSPDGVEIMLADGARGQTAWVSGGAVFRGFYVRRDLTRRIALSLARSLERIPPDANLYDESADFPSWETDTEHALPEDLDLGMRLRARLTQGELDAILQQEWNALLLHEAGHLPDVLPWATAQGMPWLEQLGRAVGSWFQDGWLLSEWEYRAQLRALATGLHADWHLAQIVETARDPGQPYYRPYRRLLRDLVLEARKLDWPPLARWHELSAADYAALAGQLAAQQGISLLEVQAARDLLATVGRLELHE